jgi:hypothetical protein
MKVEHLRLPDNKSVQVIFVSPSIIVEAIIGVTSNARRLNCSTKSVGIEIAP